MTSPEHPIAPIIILQKVHKVDTLSNTNPRIEDVTHTLPTHIDVLSKERYVLWSDLQDACTGVSYVEDRPDRDYRRRMFFMVDENYQLLQYSNHILQVYTKDARVVQDKTADPLSHVRTELQSYKDILEELYAKSLHSKDEFLRSLATAQFYHQSLLYSISQIDIDNASTRSDVERIQLEIAKLEQAQFLLQHGQHALEILEIVKNGFSRRDHEVPKLSTFDVLNDVNWVVPHHRLSRDTIGPLIDTAIAYIQALNVVNWETRSLVDGPSMSDLTSYLQLPDRDQGLGGLFRFQTNEKWTRWVCRAHTWQEPGALAVEEFLKSHGGTVDFQNRILNIHLTSKSQADQFVKAITSIEGGFEASLHIAWKASRADLMELFQGVVDAGILLIHVRWTSACTATLGHFELDFKTTKAIVLHDYPHPSKTYVLASLKDKATFGFLLRQPVNMPDIIWDILLDDLHDGINNIRDNGDKPLMVDHALQYLTLRLGRHKYLAQELTGIDVFSQTHRWEGHLVVNEGSVLGLTFSMVPTTFFPAAVTECNTLRRLVLDSYQIDDMLQVLSLMGTNPLLEQIELPAQEGNVFRRIDAIRQNYRQITLPLELTFSHQQETVLGRLAIESKDSPGTVPPSIDILQWHLDHVSEQLQDTGMEILDAASQNSPKMLSSFTLDISHLTDQGLSNVQSILRLSTLERLHIRCVPFMPFLEASVAQILRSIQWPTIKSLVLSGNNIDDWLNLWATQGGLRDLLGGWLAPTSSGPGLSSLEVLVGPESKNVLSHSSALALHHLIYSCPLVELHLENVLLENKREWELVLGAIHYSNLKKLSLDNTNAPEFQRRKAVMGGPLLRLGSRVGGWIRNVF
ncbi:hypothetical protein BG000_001605 [Podila horticola]|nr:hypothetical protein BG000_001605 [Podila horticola]